MYPDVRRQVDASPDVVRLAVPADRRETFTDSGTGTVHSPPLPSKSTTLQAGDSLAPGQSVASPNNKYRLTLQSDGKLVECDGACVIWASGTNPGGASAVMQDDGNFVVYNASNAQLWSSRTAGPAAYLVLGNNGGSGSIRPAESPYGRRERSSPQTSDPCPASHNPSYFKLSRPRRKQLAPRASSPRSTSTPSSARAMSTASCHMEKG